VPRNCGEILAEHQKSIKKDFLEGLGSENRRILRERMLREINTEVSDLHGYQRLDRNIFF
jgi:hypothetical protein